MACGGEADEVGHLSAGDERRRRAVGQAEQVDEPAGGDVLGDRGGRGERDEPGVLVPGRGEPVGRERGRVRAADDEAEVARAGGGDDPALGTFGERLDDRGGILGVLGERTAERGAQLRRRSPSRAPERSGSPA